MIESMALVLEPTVTRSDIGWITFQLSYLNLYEKDQDTLIEQLG